MTTIIALPPLLGEFVGGGIFNCFGGVDVRWNLLPRNPRKGKIRAPWLGAPADSRVVQLPISATITPGDILPTPLPKSLDIAAQQIDDLVRSTPGDILLVGYSKGAQGISRWLDNYADKLSLADKARIRIVVWGDPLRLFGGYGVGRKEFGGRVGTAMRTDSGISITDVAIEGDGFADAPTRPCAAAERAAAQDRWGINSTSAIHAWAYQRANFNDPRRKTCRVGGTLFVLLPHAPLIGSAADVAPGYDRPEQ